MLNLNFLGSYLKIQLQRRWLLLLILTENKPSYYLSDCSDKKKDKLISAFYLCQILLLFSLIFFQVRVCGALSWWSRSGHTIPGWLLRCLLPERRFRRELHCRNIAWRGLFSTLCSRFGSVAWKQAASYDCFSLKNHLVYFRSE